MTELKHQILVVEDNRMMAILLTDVLQVEGYEVVGPAFTLREGQDLTNDRKLDAAIVDYNLRGESAAPLIWQLYAVGVPTIVFSGASEIAENSLPLGVTYVAKGPGVTQLLPTLKRMCSPSGEGAP